MRAVTKAAVSMLLVVGVSRAADPPTAATNTGEARPVVPPTKVASVVLPLVADYSDEMQDAAGIGPGCVLLEAADVRFVFPDANIDASFMKYRASVRDAIEPIGAELKVVRDRDPEGKEEPPDPVFTRHRDRVWAAVDAAQLELVTALGADAIQRQRMTRHAQWRPMSDGATKSAFDSGMLFEDLSHAETARLRSALEAHDDAWRRVQELITTNDVSTGLVCDARIAAFRSALRTPGWTEHEKQHAQARADAMHDLSNALLDGVAVIARECGASAEALEWRARAFKLASGALLPSSDLIDAFDAARTADDALDVAAMRETRVQALEQRDAAVFELTQASWKCRRSLAQFGPLPDDAERLVRRFEDATEQWEKCEQQIGAHLKAQLRDPACSAAGAIDAYLVGQEALAWDHWRDRLVFWQYYVHDHRVVK